MGTSNGGIAIKTETSKIDLLKVAKDIFGNNVEKSETHCDPRHSDCAYIGKTKDFLIIRNTELAYTFFETQTTEKIQHYLDYFSKPDLVFAFEEYDSGGTYSYSLIYEGKVKRQFRSITYETQTDFGELEPVEINWKNAEVINEDLGDGEYDLLYKDPIRDLYCSRLELPRVILQELMLEKLGFTSEDMYRFITEYDHFKMTPKTVTKGVTERIVPLSNKKSWWKFW